MRECHRVGKKKVDRPVRVPINRREVAADVWRHSKELRQISDFKHVYINPDETIEELAERKNLYDCSSRRSDATQKVPAYPDQCNLQPR